MILSLWKNDSMNAENWGILLEKHPLYRTKFPYIGQKAFYTEMTKIIIPT